MLKRIFLIFFLLLSFSFLNSNLSLAQNNTTYQYQNISSFDGSQQKTTITDSGVGGVLNYLLTFMGIAIVMLVLFRLLQGAFLKGTYGSIYDQAAGNKSLQVAGVALIVFILAYAILSFINPALTGWSVATDYISTLKDISNGNNTNGNKCTIDSTYIGKSVEDQIKWDEERGVFHPNVYLDQKGLATIGWGFNLTQSGAKNDLISVGIDGTRASALVACTKASSNCPTITQGEADGLFNIKFTQAKKAAQTFVGSEVKFNALPANVQNVLINMSYNMGSFSDFPKSGDTSQGLQSNDWPKMANGIQDSKYCNDVQDRCGRVVGLLLGVCPKVVDTSSGSSYSSNSCINTVKALKKEDLVSIVGKIPCNENPANPNRCTVQKKYLDSLILLNESYKKEFGKEIEVTSSFRTQDYQKSLCSRTSGACASQCSNHMTGLAVDFTNETISKSCGKEGICGSKEFQWLKANGDKFGVGFRNDLGTTDNIHWSFNGH